MTFTAGELVNQLRALDPSTPVYVCAEGDDPAAPTARRRGWLRLKPLPLAVQWRRPITRARVRTVDDRRFAYIEYDTQGAPNE